jgi:hypothetical protein
MQQAGAAQTRGEINVLTQGLSAVAPAPAAWTPTPRPVTGPPLPRPPAASSTPPHVQQSPPSWTPPAQQAPVPQPFAVQPPVRKKSAARPVVIGLIVVLVSCGGGLVSCVSSVVDEVRDGSSSSPSTSVADPQTEEGWDEMVEAFDDEADLSKTVGLMVRRSSATLSVEAGDSAAARYYFDGDVTSATEVRRTTTEQLFDLADIDGSVVEDAVSRARTSSESSASDEAWIMVWAGATGPRIVVTFPTANDTYALVVDTDGATVSETP